MHHNPAFPILDLEIGKHKQRVETLTRAVEETQQVLDQYKQDLLQAADQLAALYNARYILDKELAHAPSPAMGSREDS